MKNITFEKDLNLKFSILLKVTEISKKKKVLRKIIFIPNLGDYLVERVLIQSLFNTDMHRQVEYWGRIINAILEIKIK